MIAEQVEQALVGGSRTRLDTRHAEEGERLDKKILQTRSRVGALHRRSPPAVAGARGANSI